MGLHVEPGDPTSIADGVIRMLFRPLLARKLAAEANEKVKPYNWESTSEATLRAYREATGEPRHE